MKNVNSLSVVVPAYNEALNLQPLIERIASVLIREGILYEIIIIDDRSTDATAEVVKILKKRFPVRYYLKKGKPGKAFSLLEGFDKAKYAGIAMIDGDLQYPPEALPEMVEKLSTGTDVVVANRTKEQSSWLRVLASRVFMVVFGQWLHGMNYDIQSGLKVFRKIIIKRIKINPSPWTFDLEFLLKARDAGYTTGSVDIVYSHRLHGESKVKLMKATWEIASHAIKAKFLRSEVVPVFKNGRLTIFNGFHFKGNKYSPYTNMKVQESALQSILGKQIDVFASLVLLVLIYFLVDWQGTLVLMMGLLTFLYFSDIFFHLLVIMNSFRGGSKTDLLGFRQGSVPEKDLPTYTILCPLYKEWEVLGQFVQAIRKLNYPKEKLQVLLLLEADDRRTIRKVKERKLPANFEVVVVPDSKPKTKPKACNFALTKATGEYSVIYDAEDIPEPMQLKKVATAFAQAPNNVVCIQAKLDFYNPEQNLLTKLFTAEYSLWFDITLPGLQALDAPIPLGGTSNHFKTTILKRLQGWDPFNVTEDCDLGVRLSKNGYRTMIVDSVTHEEANSGFFNWFNQRSRWIKGYIQTFLVHSRQPRAFAAKTSWFQFVAFVITIGGKIMSLYINPLMWVLTLTYFLFRSRFGPLIEALFPAPVFYLAVISLVVGNFMYFYYYMVGTVKRGYYELVKYCLLVPFYWLGMSAAAWVALYRLITTPHHWSKTTHGLHLKDHRLSIRSAGVPKLQPSYTTAS